MRGALTARQDTQVLRLHPLRRPESLSLGGISRLRDPSPNRGRTGASSRRKRIGQISRNHASGIPVSNVDTRKIYVITNATFCLSIFQFFAVAAEKFKTFFVCFWGDQNRLAPFRSASQAGRLRRPARRPAFSFAGRRFRTTNFLRQARPLSGLRRLRSCR